MPLSVYSTGRVIGRGEILTPQRLGEVRDEPVAIEDQADAGVPLAVLLPHARPGPTAGECLVLGRIVIGVDREGEQVGLVPNLRSPGIELPIVRLGMARVTRLALSGGAPVGGRLGPPGLVLEGVAHRPIRRETQPPVGEDLLEGPFASRVVVEEVSLRKLSHLDTLAATVR